MALLPIDTLIRGLTKEEALESLYDALESVEVPARKWRDGGTAKAFLGVVAALGSIGATVISNGIRAGFLEWAEDGWARVLARLQYGVDPFTASYAAGKLTLTNQGAQTYSWGQDEQIAKCTATGKRYRISTAADGSPGFPELGPGVSLTVDAIALEPGSPSSASPGEIDALEPSLTRVVVGNPAAFVGVDEESVELLKQRCYLRPATQSGNGPRNAYEYAVRSALLPSGEPTSINRVTVQPADGTGVVVIVIATSNGTPTAEELEAARLNVELIARTDTDTVVLEGAIEVPFSNTMTVWRKGADDSVVRAAVNSALLPLFASYPIGGIKKYKGAPGYLWADAVEGAAIAAHPAVFDVDQTSPDLELAYNEIPSMTTTILVRTAAS